MVSLDFVVGNSADDFEKLVRVHRVTLDRESGEAVQDCPFMPSKVVLNDSEKCFVLFGDNGVLVGNFPAMLQNYRHSKADREDGRLAEPAKDCEVACVPVPLDDVDDKEAVVVQAEFSSQNTNYLLVLLRKK